MAVTIASLPEAKQICGAFDYIISITDPNVKLPSLGPNHIHVRFLDAEHPDERTYTAMVAGVTRILSWVREHNLTGKEKILVHCHAGVSRSAAIAWALLVMFGEDYETAYQALHTARPIIWPNLNVVQLADSFLGCDGAFLRVARSVDFRSNSIF